MMIKDMLSHRESDFRSDSLFDKIFAYKILG